MGTLDLVGILDRFSEVCRAKFGKTYKFEPVEKKLLPVREGQRELTARDVALMFDPSKTPLAKYWPPPREKELAMALRGERLRLHKISLRPQKLFLQLLNLFHNAGVASIVLRFVHPDQFGIFSTPVLNLLQIQRPRTVDLYLDFCEELREWQQRFSLHTVAETEMALWTYDQLSKGVMDQKEADRIRRQFETDLWIQRRRLSQTLSPFLRRYGPFEMARIVVDIDPNLAGKIAAEEYDRLLKCASLKYRKTALNLKQARAGKEFLNWMASQGHIKQTDSIDLKRLWEIRNTAVHSDESPPTAAEVDLMLDVIERICRRWENR